MEYIQSCRITTLFCLIKIPATINHITSKIIDSFPLKIFNLATDFYLIQELGEPFNVLKVTELYSIKYLRVSQTLDFNWRELLRKGSRRQNFRGVVINAVGTVITVITITINLH